MHLLVDTTNGRALARHDSHKALTALHYIQFANVEAVVLACGTNKAYAKLDSITLKGILAQAHITDIEHSYGELIRMVRAAVEDAGWLLLPFNGDEIVAQAYQVEVKDTRPMAFMPGSDRPALLPAWCSAPQRNVARADSSFWIEFASGLGAGQLVAGPVQVSASHAIVRERTTPPPPPHKEDKEMATKKAAKKAAKPAAPKKPSKPAKPAAPAKASDAKERNGVKPPRAGGNTAVVFDICEQLYKDKRNKAPSFAEVDAKVGKKDIPDATRRSTYAYWRKYRGITGRVVVAE